MNLKVQDLNIVMNTKDQENTSIGTAESLNEQDLSIQIDRQKNEKKFQFINQSSQNWPQWSVEQTHPQEEEPFLFFQNKNNLEKDITKFLTKYMYNRGMTGPLRQKIMGVIGAQAKKIKQENQNRPQSQKINVRQQIDRRLQGWRKKLLILTPQN